MRWQIGKQYAFEYSGRLLTGLPQLAPHYSGVGLKATVLVDVLAQNKLQISLENPSYARVNQRLEPRLHSMDGLDGANWRELILPARTRDWRAYWACRAASRGLAWTSAMSEHTGSRSSRAPK